VGEQDVDVLACSTLDVHKVRVGALDKALELVGLGLVGTRRVEDVEAEGHGVGGVGSCCCSCC